LYDGQNNEGINHQNAKESTKQYEYEPESKINSIPSEMRTNVSLFASNQDVTCLSN